jgi:hypothetical protein
VRPAPRGDVVIGETLARTAACTIVAANRLAYARVAARSFRRHHPDIPFVVLLADERPAGLDPAGEPFTLVELPALGIPQIERLRFRHAQQPFSYACTPWLLAWLLASGVERAVFFKQETLILDEIAPLFEHLATAPIVVTPHLVAPLAGADAVAREVNVLLSGAYNAGVVGVSAHATAHRFLAWWRDRLRTDCRLDVAAGLHFEQRWLDLALGYFDGVHVLRDPAFNVGHWSLPERRLEVEPDGGVRVDGRRCRVFRFSGYQPEAPTRATTYDHRLSWGDLGAARLLFERVHQALMDEGHDETRHWPYAYQAFDNGVPIPVIARELYAALGEPAAAFGDPRETRGSGRFWHWLTAPAAGTGLSRLWDAVYTSRPDLQQAFPAIAGADRAAFDGWARHSGLAEHQIPAALLDGVPA